MAFGKKDWAAPFMSGRRNGLYTSEELFVCETLQKIGVVGEKRLGYSFGKQVWPEPGVVLKRFEREEDDLSRRMGEGGKRENFLK